MSALVLRLGRVQRAGDELLRCGGGRPSRSAPTQRPVPGVGQRASGGLLMSENSHPTPVQTDAHPLILLGENIVRRLDALEASDRRRENQELWASSRVRALLRSIGKRLGSTQEAARQTYLLQDI